MDGMTLMGTVGFGVYLVMTIAFFAWIAYLAISK